MKRSLACFTLLFLILASTAGAAQKTEWVLLVGGPSMYQWEQYKAQPHDHWWANFVRAARLRTEQIQNQYGKDQMITWLVYRHGYEERAKQEKQDLVQLIDSIRDKFGIHLVWFDRGREVIDYLNHGQPRDQLRIGGFEYFGHSNKACFMFDYSNNIDSACKSWLHEKDLRFIDRRDFAHGAYVKSWGCHTGESMSQKWFTATGTRMIGAIGKTQFMLEELPILTSQNGHWTN